MNLAEEFSQEIDAYLEAAHLSATALGRAALGDPGFVFGLRNGRSPSLRTIDKVRAFMRANPPKSEAA